MRKAGEIISSLLEERFGKEFLETARSSAGLFTSWEKIVSEVWSRAADLNDMPVDQGIADIPAVAAHSQIREFERGILLVEADHPGWIQILQIKQNELLKAVQRRCPEMDVRGIAFTLSRGSFSPGRVKEENSL